MRRQLFTLVVLVTLGLVAFIGVVLVQPELLAGLAGRTTTGHISEHFREPQHRVHDLTFGFLLGIAVVGTLSQLREPSHNAAAQVMAFVPIAGLALAAALTNTAVLSFPWVSVGALVLLATSLHPTVGGLLGAMRPSRADPVMLALTGIAAVPLLAFASTNLELQRRGVGEHAALGHYGFMAAVSFTAVGLGVLAGMRPQGWRITAWVAGALVAALGLTSIVFTNVESSFALPGAIAAIAWGVGFTVRAERSGRGRRDLDSSPAAGSEPSRSKP